VRVDADFSTAEAAELLFRPIRARAVKRVRFLMVDPFDFETLMQVVPGPGLVGMPYGPLGNTSANEGGSLALGTEYCWNRVPPRSRTIATTFEDHCREPS
jgi:hypothetical protein